MKPQIKVYDTRMHNRKGAFCTIAEAELILIESYSGQGNWIEVDGRLKKPILISKTEKIETDDWALLLDSLGNPFLQPQQYKGQGVITKDHRKILALPEHFSPKQLEAIKEGKLKHGDAVLVECHVISAPMEFGVKFNTLNFMTLYKAEEKMFTRSEVIDFCYAYKDHILTITRSGRNISESEWFKQNIK